MDGVGDDTKDDGDDGKVNVTTSGALENPRRSTYSASTILVARTLSVHPYLYKNVVGKHVLHCFPCNSFTEHCLECFS